MNPSAATQLILDSHCSAQPRYQVLALLVRLNRKFILCGNPVLRHIYVQTFDLGQEPALIPYTYSLVMVALTCGRPDDQRTFVLKTHESVVSWLIATNQGDVHACPFTGVKL